MLVERREERNRLLAEQHDTQQNLEDAVDESEGHSIWDFTEALSMYRGAEANTRQPGFSGYTKDSQLKQCFACLLCYSRFICTCENDVRKTCLNMLFSGPERNRPAKENL
jgi:hypothetical protein